MTSEPLELPEGFELREFRPVAYYDSHMDCIRALILDRSVTEERIDDFLTIYRTNHPGQFDNAYCGFCLKGIRHLVREVDLPDGTEITLAMLLDGVIKARPHSTLSKVLEEFPPDQRELVIEDIDELKLAA